MSRTVLAFALALCACQSGAAIGTTCTRESECASPLACRFGRCRVACVAQRDCPLGATCLLDQNGIGSCTLIDDPDCTPTSCDAPLACFGRTCVNLCEAVAECPMGSSCVPTDDHRARCVRTDGQDAGLSDTGVDDAGVDDAGVDASMQSFDAGDDASDTNTDAGPCTPSATGHAPCETALDVVVADGHSCVRSALPHSDDGHLWCWGELRTLGRNGDTSLCTTGGCPIPAHVRVGDTTTPADANDVERVLLSTQGGCYTTHTTGLMVCWGTQDYEAPLGTGVATGEIGRPVLLSPGHPFSATDTFTVFGASAIVSELVTQQWYGWGDNDGNVLNLPGSAASESQAVALGTGWADIRSVAAGETHGCGIATGGGVVCWGSNTHGESAPGRTDAWVAPTPLVMPADAGVSEDAGMVSGLAMGRTHSCMLANGQIYCWGEGDPMPGGNPCGMANCPPTRLDTGTHPIESLTPVSYANDLCFVDATDHHLYCWGQGYGSFGASIPTAIPNLPQVSVAWLTSSHGCAIDTNAQTWCWGQNDLGQLGLGAGVVDGAIHQAALVVWP